MAFNKQRKINTNSILDHKPIIDSIFRQIFEFSDIVSFGLVNKRCQLGFKTKNQQLKLKQRVTIEINLDKVKYDGYKLEFIKEQTLEICLSAVNRSGNVLKYVKEQTLEICLAAIKQNE